MSPRSFLAAASLSALLILSLASTQSFAQAEGLARETLEKLITVPPSELSDDDLALRIQLNRRLVNDNVEAIGGVKLRTLLQADRRERRRRTQSGNASTGSTTEETAQAESTSDDTAQNQEQVQQTEQTTDNNRTDNRAARQFLRDAAPADGLSIRDLRGRIQQVGTILRQGNLRPAVERDLRALRTADQTALDQKIAARNAERQREQQQQAQRAARADNPAAREIFQDSRRAQDLPIRQLRARISAANALLQNGKLGPNAERRLRDFRNNDRAVLDQRLLAQRDVDRGDQQAARAVLNDQRRADRMGIPALRNRIREATTLLQNSKLNANLERRLRDFRNNDRTVLDQRLLAERGVNRDANREARQLLQDNRRPGQLGVPELRERVQRTRALLQEDGLRDNLEAQLLARLENDRNNLRQRVAQRQGDRFDDRIRERILGNQQLRADLFNDRRPSSRLSDADLDQRIDQAVTLMARARLRADARNYLERLVAADRAEKRRRLIAAREERRRNLERNRNRGFSFALGDSGIRFNLDIVAAEEDSQTIQEQLIAPPRRQIDRRYTFQEFQARPELRDYMPGIELDTIRFGTNEAFIRAEEIDNLDAIGATIEQIVFERPDEVFLIEGHTDAVGSAGYNQRLSEERALAVRQALLDYFLIPPQNLEVIGYGERFLRIPTLRAEQENRRVSVRRITPLLSQR